MLKLKKIHILGFKSFCDKTELQLPGTGIAVVVGPNGCGKSNILDGVTWVLGEQSAKSLRGTHMMDVIFSGTRERKALGMAEVSLTLVDPEAYEGPISAVPEVEVISEMPEDWDEEAVQRERAAEAETLAAENQPGPLSDEMGDEEEAESSEPAVEAAENEAATSGGNAVVLKIRRRKFHARVQKGEIIITRRLFRTGESEYLLNGKLCRLRDIQDIFMGTGLGPESYAIIGQERIGQLLSAKPHDRRSIIEEAAGITRFKTKKRLSELRLESARQNLARVDDIFDEVTRQMNSLKRQAAKAERYAAVRDDLRARLRVTMVSRMVALDAEQERVTTEIVRLTAEIDAAAELVAAHEGEQHSLTERGYELERASRTAQTEANAAAVELERATTREQANRERIAELETRLATIAAEMAQAREQSAAIGEERAQQLRQQQTIGEEVKNFRLETESKQREARQAAEAVAELERRLETSRRNAMQMESRAGMTRTQVAQAEESLAALVREAERLEEDARRGAGENEQMTAQLEQARTRAAEAAETLTRVQQELAALRERLSAERRAENELRAKINQLRREQAVVSGQLAALDAQIRNHSYSTETVRKLLKANSLGEGRTPVGALADFVEVDGEHEALVDEFLREELSYLVVRGWKDAESGVQLLKTGVDGRATFVVQEASGGDAPHATGVEIRVEGVKPLREILRAQNGLEQSVESILPKVRNGYLCADGATAQRLAEQHPDGYFLAAGGECYHGRTVSGGRPAAEGPLLQKRELRSRQKQLETMEEQLRTAEEGVQAAVRSMEEMNAGVERLDESRRTAEREVANHSAMLRQSEQERQRLERRLSELEGQKSRNREAQAQKQAQIAQKQQEAEGIRREMEAAETGMQELARQMAEARQKRDATQQEAARVTAELAGFEERRRNAESTFQRIDRVYADIERRRLQLDQQQVATVAEREQRSRENEHLGASETELRARKEAALEEAKNAATEMASLRAKLAEIEQTLKSERAQMEALREQRSTLGTQQAKLKSDLEYVETGCLHELGVEAAALRLEDGLARLEDEALTVEEEACRELRQKLEAMGPVNMMALEEYKETAERHEFLEAQRKDLTESIENTMQTIREIDQISRTKFDEAFARINENFGVVFSRLFGGGQAFLRLVDGENQVESGLEIVASPPGKKLQNVLLLSGGEKALTALSLLVGIFQFQPAPFCVLDEVDAALDETNVGRLADLLHGLAGDTQFLLVTHSKRMMQTADLIYGVTMQEPGVSRVVSVHVGGREQERALA